MVSSRVVRGAGRVVGAVALVFALLPFTASLRDLHSSKACGPAVVEALHSPPKGGWYGYAPLTSTPLPFTKFGCYAPARHRLVISAAGLFVAVLLGWLAVRIEPSDGTARRHRWRLHPAGG